MDSYKPGQMATRSGEYDILGPNGKYVGRRYISSGVPFPPTPGRRQRYVLKKAITPVHTTVSSTAAMEETMVDFASALARLAKK